MTWVALFAALVVFVVLLRVLRLVALGAKVPAEARAALSIMSSSALDDEEKERRLRRMSVSMLVTFAALAGGSAVCVGVPVLLVWAGAQAGLYPLEAAVATASGIPFLVIGSIAAVGLWWLAERRARRRTGLPAR